MKKLYTDHEYNNSKSKDKLQLICYQCNKQFSITKKDILDTLRRTKVGRKYCSQKCTGDAKTMKSIVHTHCSNCNKSISRAKSKCRSKNHFCDSSCSTTYNNKHKTHGSRRSKLEVWLEKRLPVLYPNLEFHFNSKDTINSELDIYIPSLKLAFELNGIFHYEPIFGKEKLSKIQKNDKSKMLSCIEKEIDLCIIDSSGQKYFKDSTSQKYLDIIINIIDDRLI